MNHLQPYRFDSIANSSLLLDNNSPSNDLGGFHQVRSWLGRVWHQLCDVYSNRTAVRTADVVTILNNLKSKENYVWPIGEDWRMNDLGKFYQVTTWSDRAWHWLCDVCSNRTAARTARVFAAIYDQWAPSMASDIHARLNNRDPSTMLADIGLGMGVLQGYVASQGNAFLEKMKRTDPRFANKWEWFSTFLHADHANLVQKIQKIQGPESERLHLQNMQNNEYVESLVTDRTKDLTRIIRELQDANLTLKQQLQDERDKQLHLSQEALRAQRAAKFEKTSPTS